MRHVDADVAELTLQHLGDALAHDEPGLRDQREGQPLPAALADAVAVVVTPSGFVQQRTRARRVECVFRDRRRCRPTTPAGWDRA